jgi:hypothetical protein
MLWIILQKDMPSIFSQLFFNRDHFHPDFDVKRSEKLKPWNACGKINAGSTVIQQSIISLIKNGNFKLPISKNLPIRCHMP